LSQALALALALAPAPVLTEALALALVHPPAPAWALSTGTSTNTGTPNNKRLSSRTQPQFLRMGVRDLLFVFQIGKFEIWKFQISDLLKV
jgi:hypothetical protein